MDEELAWAIPLCQPVPGGQKHYPQYIPHHATSQPNAVLFLIVIVASLANTQLELHQRTPLEISYNYSTDPILMCYYEFPNL